MRPCRSNNCARDRSFHLNSSLGLSVIQGRSLACAGERGTTEARESPATLGSVSVGMWQERPLMAESGSLELAKPEDVERVFATVRETRPQALLTHPTPIVGRVYKEIAAFAIAERLPTITGNSVYVREGLLMSYSPDLARMWRLRRTTRTSFCG